MCCIGRRKTRYDLAKRNLRNALIAYAQDYLSQLAGERVKHKDITKELLGRWTVVTGIDLPHWLLGSTNVRESLGRLHPFLDAIRNIHLLIRSPSHAVHKDPRNLTERVGQTNVNPPPWVLGQ
jgi:hypothetical protein